jgi:hypothetical protein
LEEFTNDLITVDEKCGGGGGLVHTSKFAAFMVLKIMSPVSGWWVSVVGGGPVMLMSAPIVV